MSAEYFLSLFLLIIALVAVRRTSRAVMESILLFATTVLAVVLLVGYAAADYFTGEGINSATLYHLQYGLEGAGFREYRVVIGLGSVALIGSAALVGFCCFSKTQRGRAPRMLVAAFGFVAGSLVANPATWDVVELAKPRPPATADFMKHYRTPRIAATAEEHPNLVFIYAESLERTYFDESVFPGLIKELRALESRAYSFTNIHTLEGTGFTMGGIVASLCGVPLFGSGHANSMRGMDAFLPGAIGLTDLLHQQAGYHFAFMGGANLVFAGKAKFLKTHHFEEAWGFSELHGRVADKSYINNWGLYDDTLLEMAFERFVELSEQPQRFGLFLLTLDTHHPDGHVSRSVSQSPYGDGKNSMLNAVAASDRLLGKFVRRIQESKYGRNTVVVVASDHLAMNNAASELLMKGERRNLFMVLDPRNSTPAQISRTGSTLDIGSTLLPFLGFKGVIGLGRDLRDAATSDDEIAYLHRKETVPAWRGELLKFWQFPEFRETLSFDENTAEIILDGRRFSAPVLIENGRDRQTNLRFEFDTLWDVRLAEQVDKLDAGTSFALVAKREDVAKWLPPAQSANGTPWVLVVGRAGGGKIARPLSHTASLKRAEFDALLRELDVK